ncbi:AMP-binding protein [Bradyrhizobium sp. NP1]|uniref:AMP-binding protein n=1 Tax=Bradyrhizobium sp. NP1 TaxID=3049772 RepID=UPI0025A54139|nr:AMP-binding protein [Bradyrhizobium sp. NP1]WJR76776.1 AMP-binding protein [Bradyrhizobium sp. NP1]
MVHEPSYRDRSVRLSTERIASQAGAGWADRIILDYFDEHRRRIPGKPAIVSLLAETGATKRVSFGELGDAVDRIALRLFRLGVRRGDVVSFQLNNRWEFIALSLACVRLGALQNPLMPVLRERELRFMLGLAESKIFVVPRSFRQFDHAVLAEKLKAELPALEHVIVLEGTDGSALTGPPSEFDAADFARFVEPLRPHPNDLMQLLYTSGTTGEPKGVMHTANTILANVVATGERFAASREDVMFCPSPLAHQLGFLWGLLLPMMVGATTVLLDVWKPDLAAKLLAEEKATICMGATPFLADLTDFHGTGDMRLGAFRLFISGGAPIPSALVRRARANLGATIVSVWGMTEVCAATTVRLDDAEEKAFGTDGVAVPHMAVRVVDGKGSELPNGTEGHLQTRGASVFVGYLKRPQLNAFATDDWFETGDLARRDQDGYIRITGRSKDVIIRGGENLPVVEIEAVLYKHPAVAQVAIVAMPDQRLGERPCAYVRLRAGTSLTLPDVQAFLGAQGVSKSFMPERLEIIEEMPMTATGKVQKFVLREMASSLTHEIRKG